MNRDFIGYGKETPKVFWPQDNKIAVSFVVNLQAFIITPEIFLQISF